MNAKVKAAIIFVVAVAQIALAQPVVQTNFITFTNKAGDIVSNAEVLSWNAVDLFYAVPGGGTRVHLADLPSDLQNKYGYNKKIADATINVNRIRQAALAEQRSEQGQRIATQVANAQFKEAVLATKVVIYGRIIQKMNDGTMLVNSGSDSQWDSTIKSWTIGGIRGTWGTCLLVGCDQGVDGENVNIIAYPDGQWTYTTVTGASKTVRRFQCYGGLVTHVATQEEVQRMTTRD